MTSKLTPAIMSASRSLLILIVLVTSIGAKARSQDMLIHDFSNQVLTSELGTEWRAVSDQVMGGVSKGHLNLAVLDGRDALHLTGDVRLENDGGFIQAALDLKAGGGDVDASPYNGVRLLVRGNGERYNVHLRTADNLRPWQSYRASFVAGSDWQTIDLPFADFAPHRLDAALDLKRLRRLGLVAIGRAFKADLAIAEISFYR